MNDRIKLSTISVYFLKFIFVTVITGFSLNLFGESAQNSVSGDQITILYDAFGNDNSMQKDWGFAALIEAQGKRILFDTGNNAEVLAHNVMAKGIDLTELDFAIISHRHGDHMGGLNYLLEVNPDVQIYVPKENFGVFGATLPGVFYRQMETLTTDMRYFDGKPPKTLHFGTPWPEGKFTWVHETFEVEPGFHIIYLHGDWGVDLPVKEISLAIDTPRGIVLVVGCSHPTIERIVAAASSNTNKPIHLVVGGLHLLPANDEEIKRIATSLKNNWNIKQIGAGHCTGEPAFKILKETFGESYLYAGLGSIIPLYENQHAFNANDKTDFCYIQ